MKEESNQPLNTPTFILVFFVFVMTEGLFLIEVLYYLLFFSEAESYGILN